VSDILKGLGGVLAGYVEEDLFASAVGHVSDWGADGVLGLADGCSSTKAEAL